MDLKRFDRLLHVSRLLVIWFAWFPPSPLLAVNAALALTRSRHSVRLPVLLVDNKTPSSATASTHELLQTVFDDIVNSTDFFVKHGRSSCVVPALGEDVLVTFQQTRQPTAYALTVSGAATTREDFGWICTKFFESRDSFKGLLDMNPLYDVVIDHFNRQPADPGVDAETAAYAESDKIAAIFSNPQILKDLETTGYAVIDGQGVPVTTPQQHEKLSHFLRTEKTNQEATVRTDSVHFLNREEAITCGLCEHFDVLMGIASYLNKNLRLRPSQHPPLPPATVQAPLTIPRRIQFAEYEHTGFYRPHSDNSLTETGVRSNFRHITAILYCNDDWNGEEDGGALRIYPGSRNLTRPADAVKQQQEYLDIFPVNGRLVLFDSCLIHSVEKVTSTTKVRRALTLWINRPDHSGVQGESYT